MPKGGAQNAGNKQISHTGDTRPNDENNPLPGFIHKAYLLMPKPIKQEKIQTIINSDDDVYLYIRDLFFCFLNINLPVEPQLEIQRDKQKKSNFFLDSSC